MSFDVLKTRVSSLSSAERRKLMAFMVTLEDQKRENYADELAGRMNDRSPERWLTVEECEQKLGLRDDPQ